MPDLDTTAISRTRATGNVPGYSLEKLVGRGGMGEVHRATQLSLGRTVAVKLLSRDLAEDKSFVARFQKEAAALATLRHPHIVSIVDKGQTEDTYFLVMEFVDGPSLREVMRSPLLDTNGVLRIMMEIARAIDYAHGRGVIHRDLKPENILFDEQAGGIPKVSDFGLASFLEGNDARFEVTATHVAMGTLAYMAPEQRVDAKTADGRADIFSFGVILYEMLVGELPMGNFDPPSQRKPGLDPRLDAVVFRCLRPDPSDRYPSMAALISDLEPLAPPGPSQVPQRLSRVQRLGLSVRRAVRVAVRTAALLVVLAALGVLGVAALRNAQQRPEVQPGAALAADLGPPSVLALPGRLEQGAEQRRVLVGEGPDQLGLVVTGRPLTVEAGALAFAPVSGQSRVGLARVDVVDVDGRSARLSAVVSADGDAPSLLSRARAALLGPPPPARAALMLQGSAGRYVALVLSGESAAPLRLEWALGERRGTMLGLPSPQGPARLELAVDDEGLLRAYVGAGQDRRAVGEPLNLGPEWTRQFGEPPAPALGCIEGGCRAEKLAYAVRRDPPPAPAAAPAPVAAAAAPPVPAAVPHAAAVQPARAVVKKPVAAPAPQKKAVAKPAPVRAKRR
ncbi:serine/threonine protein kinase [Aggregicoccus sp. 17bor-14]|uniref:serine/threonine-protein kinase n=1 Tax=Myxococcaceae TaxID=31 RepID=UPI00129C443B|nr:MULTISPECIES: serine/threonine-protein kinase [Myxococcaceae]MBF5045140.1 protein kinase [Simulacricoccus sp. 17bor-14]MRI90882.1 serine/threonine protein kinase [Aggregicoccus sp. 17bor-14]